MEIPLENLNTFSTLQLFFIFEGSKEQSSTQHTSSAYQKSTSKSLDLTNDSDNLGIYSFIFFSLLFVSLPCFSVPIFERLKVFMLYMFRY